MRKELFDLTEDDLLKNHVWFFPGDETGSDTMVATVDEPGYDGQQTIHAAFFTTKIGVRHIGYVYFDERDDVMWIKPVLIKEAHNLNFWTGIRRPNDQKLEKLRQTFGEGIFPIEYHTISSDHGLDISGLLDGIYFLESDDRTSFRYF